jgi:hypothetical protein
MIKGDIIPAVRYVACRANLPKLAIMVIILRMAGITFLGRSLKDTILMAGITNQIRMLADEGKCSAIVIECHIQPFSGFMACSTIPAELSLVDILRCVTGETIFGSVFENTVYVT